MSSKTFTISKAYVLSAINKLGKRVYYDIDYHSGGYSYWSVYSLSCKRFDSLDKIPTFRGTDYMLTDVVTLEVLEIKEQARVVESTELVSEARAKAMLEIVEIEKELARKVAMLGDTK
jgi:hypothetical protein